VPNLGELLGGRLQAETTAQAQQRLYDAYNNMPVVRFVNDARALDLSPPGVCPDLVIDTTSDWFGELRTDVHCQLIQQNQVFITNVVRLAWLLSAVFLFLLA